MQHLRVIARAPHPIGSAGSEEVRRYLVDQLRGLGLNPHVQSGTGFSRFIDWLGSFRAGNAHNILGRLPGTANTRAVLLVAHYDSFEQGPAAADDGAGVATILETIRAAKAQSPLRNDLIVLFTDGEEFGSLGADLFATSHPWVKGIGVVLNFDNAGAAGPAWMVETSKGNRWLIGQFAAAAQYPFASSVMYSGILLKGGSPTDLPVLMRAGLAGLNFGFGAIGAGAEIIPGNPAEVRWPRRLVGWSKVELAPGESKTVGISLEPLHLSIFNVEKDACELVPCEYRIFVGGSSRDMPLTATVQIPAR